MRLENIVMSLKIFSKERSSPKFVEVFGHQATTTSVLCEMCNRVHFLDPTYSLGEYDTGEYEDLDKKSEIKPEKYVLHPGKELLPYIEFNGKQVVLTCECGFGAILEKWLMDNSEWVNKFYVSHLEIESGKQSRVSATDELHIRLCTH